MFEQLDKRMSDISAKAKQLRDDRTDEELLKRFEWALAVIEEIGVMQEELPKHLKTKREKRFHGAITQIYRIAHTARLPGCFDKHESWEEEFQELKSKLEAL